MSEGHDSDQRLDSERLRRVAAVTTIPVALAWGYLLLQINWLRAIRQIPDWNSLTQPPMSHMTVQYTNLLELLISSWYGNLTVFCGFIATILWLTADRMEAQEELANGS